MHLFLPKTGRPRHRIAGRTGHIRSVRSTGRTPFHDHFHRAADPHEQHWEAGEAPGALVQDAEWPGIVVVMTNVGDDVQPQPAVRRDGLIKPGIEIRHDGFEIGAFPARTQTYAGAQPRRRQPRIAID